jgi:hypothetical protein
MAATLDELLLARFVPADPAAFDVMVRAAARGRARRLPRLA